MAGGSDWISPMGLATGTRHEVASLVIAALLVLLLGLLATLVAGRDAPEPAPVTHTSTAPATTVSLPPTSPG